jgi:ankyrin repeat protein
MPTDLYGKLLLDMRRDPSVLQRHLDSGHRIDAALPQAQGETLLYRACSRDIEALLSLKGSEALVKQLLRAGADPNSRNCSEGWTALMATSSADVADYLLDNGADIEREADDGSTAIEKACAGGKMAVVKVLLKRGALAQLLHVSKSGHTALSAAVNSQHEDVTLLLLQNLVQQPGFDINHPRLAANQPLLCCAAVTGQCRVVEFALDHGAGVNSTGPSGPPLNLAVLHKQLSTVKLLCQRGADLQTRFRHNQNSLEHAITTYNAEMVKLLIRHGADVNAAVGDGLAPVELAALSGNCSVLQVLLDAGAALSAQMQYNAVANLCDQLDDAAAVKVLKVLLPHCSNFADDNYQLGCYMLVSAVSAGKLQVARALHAAGARALARSWCLHALQRPARHADALRS